jgi:hypothetical protein
MKFVLRGIVSFEKWIPKNLEVSRPGWCIVSPTLTLVEEMGPEFGLGLDLEVNAPLWVSDR